jgi:hypothetical protein
MWTVLDVIRLFDISKSAIKVKYFRDAGFPLNDDGVPRIASENYVSSNGVEAGDDEDLRADREEQPLAGGRCGDESPRDE